MMKGAVREATRNEARCRRVKRKKMNENEIKRGKAKVKAQRNGVTGVEARLSGS
jgi:hypothetical protein